MAATKTTGNKKDRPVEPGNSDNTRRLFFVSALNMSWQLAIVVLVPVVGGFKIDQAVGSLPLLTIFGFVIALFCTVIVVQRQVQAFGPPPPKSKIKDDDDD